MANAIFIDTSNLNTLFKVNGKFVIGVNYSQCPEKLAIDAQALGSSFDVYLSVWPRQRGEGKNIINEISVGGVPFVVNKREIEAILNLMEGVPGVGTVYICNALANFCIQARVSNFQSVIYYGNRIAFFTVKEKLLSDLKIFDSQDEFYDEMGEDFTCYGDLDLIDCDAIKARYDELSNFSKGIIVPLAHLITSYHSKYNVDAETVKKELRLGEYANLPKPAKSSKSSKKSKQPKQSKQTKTAPEQAPKKSAIRAEEEARARALRANSVKPRKDIVSIIASIAAVTAFAFAGVGYSFAKLDPQIVQIQSSLAPMQEETNKYNTLQGAYVHGVGLMGKVANLFEYAKSNSQGYSIAGVEVNDNTATLRFNGTAEDQKDNFVSYISQQYTVVGSNNLDVVNGAEGTTIYNFAVTVTL